MTRRQFLDQFQKMCVAYGISSILSEHAFAQSATPTRMVNFVIKYTGGTTTTDDVGGWTTSETLSPLASYATRLVVPLGLNSQFHAPMNSHAAPQVSALSGSMTGFVMYETEYPTGNLKNFTEGGGKSIDVLIGEKLKSQHQSAIPYLLMTNNTLDYLECTHRTSSWGANGQVLSSISTISDLTAEINSRRSTCERFSKDIYTRRLKAMEYVKSLNKIYSDSYVINQERFEDLQAKLQSNATKYNKDITNIDNRGGVQVSCEDIAVVSVVENTHSDQANFNTKMDRMYDLGIMAFQQNITRVLTYNLYMQDTHDTSHYISDNSIARYYAASRFMQASVARFLAKLSSSGLFDETLIFCNAGSCASNEVHNYENLSTYIINGGKSGTAGSPSAKLPVGAVHLDILNKFGIAYSTYGGSDHIYGSARKGNFF